MVVIQCSLGPRLSSNFSSLAVPLFRTASDEKLHESLRPRQDTMYDRLFSGLGLQEHSPGVCAWWYKCYGNNIRKVAFLQYNNGLH